MKTCKFCGNPAPDNMQGYCQVCYKYFVTEGKDVYPIPQDGTVEYAPNGDCICHECGKAFRKLGQHVYYAHNMTSKQYAAKHGLKLRGSGKIRLSNEGYSIHMKNVQDPKTISINLIENGKETRFNAVNGNQKQLPNHTVKERCLNCLWFDIDTGVCDIAKANAKLVMQCPILNTENTQEKEEN